MILIHIMNNAKKSTWRQSENCSVSAYSVRMRYGLGGEYMFKYHITFGEQFANTKFMVSMVVRLQSRGREGRGEMGD